MKKRFRPVKRDESGDLQSSILRGDVPLSVLEPYRMLRTKLKPLAGPGSERGCVLAVTSAQSHEGKTTNACNLAVALTIDGFRVVVVDGDLHRRGLSAYFRALSPLSNPGEAEGPGLSDYLQSGSPAPCRPWPEVPGLSVFLAGSPVANGAELLADGRLPEILEQLRRDYDYVLLDMPPVNEAADALAIAGFIDQYILVVRSGKTELDELKKAVLSIEMVKGSIVGFILNGIRTGEDPGDYSYGSH